MSFAFEKIPRMSLTCKLVPVQYRQYEYGLFRGEKIGKAIDMIKLSHRHCVFLFAQKDSQEVPESRN